MIERRGKKREKAKQKTKKERKEIVKPVLVLGLSSVRTLKRVRYTTSRCSIVRVEEGEFLISCVNQ